MINNKECSHCNHSSDCENNCQHECCRERELMLEKIKEDHLLGKRTLELNYSIWVQKLMTKQIKDTCDFCNEWIKQNSKAMQERHG